MGLCMGKTLAVTPQNAQKRLRKCLSERLSVHQHATGEGRSAQVGASRTIVATRSSISRPSIATFGSCFNWLATVTHHSHSIDQQLRKSWWDKKFRIEYELVHRYFSELVVPGCFMLPNNVPKMLFISYRR